MELIEKAQAILDNENFSDQMIAEKIGTSKMMINKYRRGITNLKDAKYNIVKSLADEYDKDEITMTEEINKEPFKYFTNRLGFWFKEAKEDQEQAYESNEGYADDKALIPVIEEINKEVSSNTSLLIDLYHIYYRNLNKEIKK